MGFPAAAVLFLEHIQPLLNTVEAGFEVFAAGKVPGIEIAVQLVKLRIINSEKTMAFAAKYRECFVTRDFPLLHEIIDQLVLRFAGGESSKWRRIVTPLQSLDRDGSGDETF